MGSFPTLALLAGNDEGVRVGSGYALLVMPSAARHAKRSSSCQAAKQRMASILLKVRGMDIISCRFPTLALLAGNDGFHAVSRRSLCSLGMTKGCGMGFCVLCLKSAGRSDFCPSCEMAWSTLDWCGMGQLPQRSDPILSSYAYRGVCRSTILAFKTKGFRRAGAALVRRMLEHEELSQLVRQCQIIMPAPSSLWSRWHGGLDLAAFLADNLSAEYDLPVQAPPLSLGFRWRKQALHSRSQRRRVFSQKQKLYDASYFRQLVPADRRSELLQVLIVDDVVTTGHTLAGLANVFEAVNFKFYTLASALRLSENTDQFGSERLIEKDSSC